MAPVSLGGRIPLSNQFAMLFAVTDLVLILAGLIVMLVSYLTKDKSVVWVVIVAIGTTLLLTGVDDIHDNYTRNKENIQSLVSKGYQIQENGNEISFEEIDFKLLLRNNVEIDMENHIVKLEKW